jgi:uncharacterized DUF497 family protein
MYYKMVKFEWDPIKAAANFKKHGISFAEAATLFFDEDTKVAPDPEHSDREERFLAIGFSTKQRLLLVAHCYRESEEVIRIISARKLTKTERAQFEEGL